VVFQKSYNKKRNDRQPNNASRVYAIGLIAFREF